MSIVPIPIFIHVKEKSDEELRKEMEMDRRMWKAEMEDRDRQRARELAEQERKLQEKRAEQEKLDKEYRDSRNANPWQYLFLPEGWSLLGQCVITPIDWDGKDGEFEFLSEL